jgi:hypothetical protein
MWHDPWVPRERTPFLITRRGNQVMNHVSDLIDPVSGRWDADLTVSLIQYREKRGIRMGLMFSYVVKE